MSSSILPQPLEALESVLANRLVVRAQSDAASISPSLADHHIQVEVDGSDIYLNIQSSQSKTSAFHLVFTADTTPLDAHLHLTLEADAQFELIEWVVGRRRHPFTLQVTATLGARARLQHTTISDVELETPLSVMRRATLYEGAQLLTTHAAFASALTHQEQHIYLKGVRAEATARLVALTDDKQEALFKTTIEHHAPDTSGLIEHYGVANASSTLLFEGSSIIHKGMKRSQARQSNKGLIIGEQARLDANPLLLIDEYDVEAGHGAAIGQIDDQQLYYLMSRGLNRKTAERLIINGYLAPLKAVITDETLTRHIETLLESKTK